MERKIKSVAEFVEAIIVETRKMDDTNTQSFWFRGEGNSNWETPLVPNSYRTIVRTLNGVVNDSFYSQKIRDIENNANADFKIRAQRYISAKGIENTYWNRYILMQHYGIKTRLLDWTQNAILALFFAISDKPTYKPDSKVWILLPATLNDSTIKTIISTDKSCYIIPTCNDSKKQNLLNEHGQLNLGELTRQYIEMNFGDKSNSNLNNYYPLAVLPIYLDERMNAQKTCFTIFGDRVNGLISNENKSKYLSSITIEGGEENKLKMLKELQLLGIDFESIYPDLDGIGLSINEKYNQIYDDNVEASIHVLKSLHEKVTNEELKKSPL